MENQEHETGSNSNQSKRFIDFVKEAGQLLRNNGIPFFLLIRRFREMPEYHHSFQNLFLSHSYHFPLYSQLLQYCHLISEHVDLPLYHLWDYWRKPLLLDFLPSSTAETSHFFIPNGLDLVLECFFLFRCF
jgi:hypothetical protein